MIDQRLERGESMLVQLPVRLMASTGRQLMVTVNGRPVVGAMTRTAVGTVWIKPR